MHILGLVRIISENSFVQTLCQRRAPISQYYMLAVDNTTHDLEREKTDETDYLLLTSY
jgi:hypothetical protein